MSEQKTVRVKVTGATTPIRWYSLRVGETFTAKWDDKENEWYVENAGFHSGARIVISGWIAPEDCEVIVTGEPDGGEGQADASN